MTRQMVNSWSVYVRHMWEVPYNTHKNLMKPLGGDLGWAPFCHRMIQQVSGNACPQDHTTLQIIFVALVFGVPQDTAILWRYLEKYTKENFTEFYFCSHFLYNSPINLNPSPNCYICIALLVYTHIGSILRHKAIRRYGHNPKIWPNAIMVKNWIKARELNRNEIKI